MDKTIVINNINKLVNDSNLSRGAFADMVGIPRSNFSKILNGNYPCGEGVINKIVLATDVRKEWLKTGDGTMYNEREATTCTSYNYNNEYTINERFREILKYKKVSIKDAAILMGKTEVYIRKLLRPGESFGIDPFRIIINSFPEINSDWLLNGHGNMLKNISENSETINNTELPEVPQIDKSDPEIITSLLSIIKEQGQALKEIALNKEERNTEEQKLMLRELKALQTILASHEHHFKLIYQKIDDLISQNNSTSQQKKVS